MGISERAPRGSQESFRHILTTTHMSISQREFLEATAIGGAAAGSLSAADTKGKLPTRVLGNTGVRVPILGMGTGSRFLLYEEEDKAVEAIRKGLDLGITYIDTADSYGKDHLSEQWVGKAIKGRKEDIFLATKYRSEPQGPPG
jgi:uncharacterized protein